jgi:hypothetical protein
MNLFSSSLSNTMQFSSIKLFTGVVHVGDLTKPTTRSNRNSSSPDMQTLKKKRGIRVGEEGKGGKGIKEVGKFPCSNSFSVLQVSNAMRNVS